MASKKISSLTSSGTLTGTELIPLAKSGANYYTTPSSILTYIKPYKSYVCRLTQTGTAAPVATILENTTGYTLTWSRSGVGDYYATATGSGLFTTASKIWNNMEEGIFATQVNTPSGVRYWTGSMYINDNDSVGLAFSVINTNGNTSTTTGSDISDWRSAGSPLMIEIRIYN